MNSYSLTTLLKLRQRNKDLAERQFMEATQKLEAETRKLELMQNQLVRKKLIRTQMQDYFFHKAQYDPCNKREVSCMAISAQKTICDEQSLKNSLDEQLVQVKKAEQRKNSAQKIVLDASRDLKAIDKHHALWQLREKKSENLKGEYDADDQNSVRYWLNKRA